MSDRATSIPVSAQDNLVRALNHLRCRYGSSQITLEGFLQHAEVALFLEQHSIRLDTLSHALTQLQRIEHIQSAASLQARGLSDHERQRIDSTIDSMVGALGAGDSHLG